MKMQTWESSLRVGSTCTAIVLTALLCAAPVANADYASGFEGLSASPFGEILTGQDGYYIPAGTSSVDFLVYTYVGNVLGLPPNPTGDDQFIAGTGPADNFYARAQRDMSFTDGAVWFLAFDFAAAYLGTGPSANNIGSFSLRNEPAGISHYIHLMSWVDPNDPTSFNAFFMGYDMGGVQFPQPGESPGSAWEGLVLDHWYRVWTKIDLEANMILQVGIIDLTTMAEAIYDPAGWYLEGGAAGASAMPESFRFFGGGSVPGNTLAFDNIDIYLEPPVATQSATWGAIKALYR